ncbi:MAG TPA: hypothetical protein VFW45_02055 [Candidatus Polarisedimenticolia bacterium]|nr:hypothetical protein [Candidatus Polarisedimenticolia bacterium]
MLPATTDRVTRNTPDDVNERIRRMTEANIARYSCGGPDAIDRRLKQLDHEWDIERYLETMAPSLTLIGMALGLTVNRKWFALPVIVQGFFLQHALQGWCPPLPFLRSLGVRTTSEIEQERYALKVLRGDFYQASEPIGEEIRSIDAALLAVRLSTEGAEI